MIRRDQHANTSDDGHHFRVTIIASCFAYLPMLFDFDFILLMLRALT